MQNTNGVKKTILALLVGILIGTAYGWWSMPFKARPLVVNYECKVKPNAGINL